MALSNITIEQFWLIIEAIFFLLIEAFLGKNPRNINWSELMPEMDMAAVKALGPGTLFTIISLYPFTIVKLSLISISIGSSEIIQYIIFWLLYRLKLSVWVVIIIVV